MGSLAFVDWAEANEGIAKDWELSLLVIDVDAQRLVLIIRDLSNVLDVLEEVVRQLSVQVELLELDFAREEHPS